MATLAVYNDDWTAAKVHLREAWVWAGARTVSWYEYDATATAPHVDSVYDDVAEAQYKAAKSVLGYWYPNPSKEQMKAWGIDEGVEGVLWLSTVLLADAAQNVTMRDRFIIEGKSYQVLQLERPTEMGEREAVLVLGLKPDR